PNFGPPRPASVAQAPVAADQWQGRTDHEKWAMIQNLPPPPANTDTNRAEYMASIKRWHARHPTAKGPTEDRPYPLTPGTAALGSGECSGCGMIGHLWRECTAARKLPPFETKWRGKFNAIKRAAAPTTAVNFVGGDTEPTAVTEDKFEQWK
ncbi:hypothetical protein DXG01_012310, partial [Tephrocybe rancida]